MRFYDFFNKILGENNMKNVFLLQNEDKKDFISFLKGRTLLPEDTIKELLEGDQIMISEHYFKNLLNKDFPKENINSFLQSTENFSKLYEEKEGVSIFHYKLI
jgi:hypothetical protein